MRKNRYQSDEYVWILCVLVILVLFCLVASGAGKGKVSATHTPHPINDAMNCPPYSINTVDCYFPVDEPEDPFYVRGP